MKLLKFAKAVQTLSLRAMHILLLISKIKKVRDSAARMLQRNFRGALVRNDIHFVKHPKVSLLIKWTYPASEVQMAGTFTNPPWQIVPLQFSKRIGCFYSTYFLETRMVPGRYYLKFVVDGNWVCNESMSISEDMQGNLNNVIEIKKDTRYVPRAHSTRNLAPETLCIPGKVKQVVELPRISSVENNINRPIRLHKDEVSNKKLILTFGSYMAAHPVNRYSPLDSTNSADALFIDPDLQIFGVADGVGEWETFGLNPGLFPKELMQNFKNEYSRISSSILHMTKEEISLLVKGCLDVAFKRTINYGSSTVLLGLIKDSVMITLCIGDSGFIVFRPSGREKKLLEVFRSKEQQHTFNCPFQLACFPGPSEYEALTKKGFGSFISLLKRSNLGVQDLPEDAHIETITLQSGDIVIAATDGLFDNLYDSDIQNISEKFLTYEYETEEFCEKLSKELVCRAVQKGWDSNYKSPFSKNAAAFGQRFIGGKLDDTTVIVAQVSEK